MKKPKQKRSQFNRLMIKYRNYRRRPASKCLFPDCDDEVYCRDLCSTHYQTAAKQVSRGVTTWAKLEKSGRVGSANRKRGAKPTVREWILKGVKP